MSDHFNVSNECTEFHQNPRGRPIISCWPIGNLWQFGYFCTIHCSRLDQIMWYLYFAYLIYASGKKSGHELICGKTTLFMHTFILKWILFLCMSMMYYVYNCKFLNFQSLICPNINMNVHIWHSQGQRNPDKALILPICYLLLLIMRLKIDLIEQSVGRGYVLSARLMSIMSAYIYFGHNK